MKKRNLLLFTLVSLLTVGVSASCNKTPSSSSTTPSSSTVTPSISTNPSSTTPSSTTPVVVTISIANKEELQAEWHASEADRRLEIAIYENGSSVDFNLNALISSGDLVISSSNTEALLVNGKILSAVCAGSVTLTVTYKGTSDSVNLEILASKAEPARKVAKLEEIFAADDSVGKTAYVTSGVVSRAYYDDGFGNQGRFYVTDGTTNTEYLVYNCAVNAGALTYDLASEKYTLAAMSDFKTNEQTKDIKVGTKLSFVAKRADYNTTKEVNALILSVDDKPVYNATKTVAELNATEPNTKELYKVTGTIKSWQYDDRTDGTKYGNFYLTDDSGEDILVYGASGAKTSLSVDNTNGEWKYTNAQDFLTSAVTKDLKVGDSITMIGFRLNFNEKIEFNGIVLGDDTEEPDQPDVPSEAEAVSISTAQTAEYTGKKVEVKGVVTAVTAKSLLISEGTGKDDNIVIWLNAAHEYQVGQYLKVTGTLVARNGNNQFDATAEIVALTDTAPVIEDTAATWTATELDAFIATTDAERGMDLISFVGTLSVTTNTKGVTYYNIIVPGSSNQFSLTSVTGALAATLENGKRYNFTGYIVDVSSSKYGNVYLTKAEAVGYDAVESVTIAGEDSVELSVGQSLQLTASVLPATADQNVTWSSDHEEFATVENGKVVGVAVGTAVITVTTVGKNSSDAVVTDTITVTVKKAEAGDVLTDTITYTNGSGVAIDNGFNFGDEKFDIINLQGTSNNAPVNKYPEIRIYGGHLLTFTAKDASYKISKIEFVISGASYKNLLLDVQSGTTSAGAELTSDLYTVGNATDKGFDVTFNEGVSSVTLTNTGKQVRFTSFVIYYTAE